MKSYKNFFLFLIVFPLISFFYNIACAAETLLNADQVTFDEDGNIFAVGNVEVSQGTI